jgi:hypothetical protein
MTVNTEPVVEEDARCSQPTTRVDSVAGSDGVAGALVLDDWAITAAHEAGHIVGCLHFGWKFGAVKIWEGEDGDVKGHLHWPAGRYDCFARAIASMCGPVAEELLTGVPVARQRGSRSDIVEALNSLARARFAEPLDLESILPFCRLLIEDQQAVILRIACELYERKELDYDEIVRLTES